jgi:hypothetical protein
VKETFLDEYKEIQWEDVDLMLLAQDGDRWQAPVKTVINLRVL